MSKTSITYGGALYDLALEEGLTTRILADLQAVCAVFRDEPDYRRLLTEPSIPKSEREALLDEAWGGQINEDNGILAVTAVSAAPMRADLQEKLRTALEAKTGKHVELTVTVDSSLIGGIRLTMQGVQYDGSVRHHLDELQRILQTSTL